MKTSRLPSPASRLRLLALLSPFSLLLAPAAASAATPAAATISAVTIYADRAVVTRTARVELTAGPNEVTFEKLPDTLVDASLQVAAGVRPRAGGSAPIVPGPVAAAATATILDVSARVTYTEASPDPREKALEEDLANLHKADRVLADEGRALAHRRELLGQIETVALAPESAGAQPGAPRLAFADWEKLLTFSDRAATDVETRQRELDEKIRDSAAKMSAAQARLRDLRGNRPARKSHKTVTVRLNAPAAGALDLALTCTLPNAGWSPVYDARLRTEARLVELGYFGLVRNATGEDWNNVALVLSTARPSLGGGSAEPSAWILDVARPVTLAQGLGRGAGGQQLAQQQAFSNTRALASNVANSVVLNNGNVDATNLTLTGAGDGTIGRVQWNTATVDTGATSATFSIKDPVTLPGDNTPRRVAIAAANLPAQLQYQSVPRTAETAFLSAYINNNTDAPLLPGEINVFLDDNFVAAGRHAAATMPGERFQLALGADEGIAIKRRLVNRLTETSGRTTRVTYEWQFTVTNNKRTPQRVMFKDVLPVSRDEKVVVKLLEPAAREIVKAEDITVPNSLPKPGITLEEDGRIVFRADVAPGKAGERKFTLKFTVEHPTDTPVAGLQ
jgi:uncharacterized protein (TIGR02231 family)